MESDYRFRTFRQEDESALIRLVRETFSYFLGGDFWVWKYRLNPDFDPSLVAVAEKDGQVVGCNHWLVRDLKLSPRLKVKAVLGSDIIVHPMHRRRGIGTRLLQFLRSTGIHKEKGAVLSYMFANPKLARRLYGPAVGYVAAPSCTTMYEKFLNCGRWREKVERVNNRVESRRELRERLEGLNTSVLFRLRGAPPFVVHASCSGVRLEEGEVEDPDAVMEGDLSFFSSLIEGKSGMWDLIKGWLDGRLRLKKGWWRLRRLWRLFKLLKMAWSIE